MTIEKMREYLLSEIQRLKMEPATTTYAKIKRASEILILRRVLQKTYEK